MLPILSVRVTELKYSDLVCDASHSSNLTHMYDKPDEKTDVRLLGYRFIYMVDSQTSRSRVDNYMRPTLHVLELFRRRQISR